MKTIKLTRGKQCQVDDAEFDELSKFQWQAVFDGRNWYARRQQRGSSPVMMHNQISPPPKGFEIDHWDRNTLNNCRENLRVATHSQNRQNTGIKANNTSGFKGVHRHKITGKWRSQIFNAGKRLHLGLFLTAQEAAKAYDSKATELFGDFALTNKMLGLLK